LNHHRNASILWYVNLRREGKQNLADDIEKVRRAEVRRGRRPVDEEASDERRRMLSQLLTILDEGNIDKLMAAMREYGLSPESPEWTETLRIWRDEREQS
jgi:hypothetical protein